MAAVRRLVMRWRSRRVGEERRERRLFVSGMSWLFGLGGCKPPPRSSFFAEEGWEVEVFAVNDGGVRAFEAAAGGGVEGEFGLWAGAFDAEFEFGGFGSFGGG